MAEMKVDVSLEKAVHQALQNIAQELWDKHGLCVKDVRFEWVDVSTAGEAKMFVTSVDAQTMTKATT